MNATLPRWLPKTMPLGDAQFLADSLVRAPGLEPMFRRAFNTPMIDRRKLISEVMQAPQDDLAQSLDVPPLWQTTPAQRADDRAQFAEVFAPNTLRDAQQAGNWARIDASFDAIADSVTGHPDVRRAGFAAEDQTRLASLLSQAMIGRDTGGLVKVKQRISAGNSQLARWVGDTGRLTNLTRALSLEADWPGKKAGFDGVWVCNGGGEIRSDAGRALRRQLVLERHDLHHGLRDQKHYAPDKLFMRLLARTEGKEALHQMLASHAHPNPRLNRVTRPTT